jgi:hypothetical protein
MRADLEDLVKLRRLMLWCSAVALPWGVYLLLAFLDLARLVRQELPILEVERRLLGGASAPECLAPVMKVAVVNAVMVAVYLSFYGMLLGLPAWLLLKHHDHVFRRLRAVWAWIAVVGYPLYFLVPTRSPYYCLDLYNHPPFTFSQSLALGALKRGVAFVYDAFPSLHVAFSMAAVLIVVPTLSTVTRPLAILWLVALHVATLTTGAHYLLDLVAGDLLGIAVWASVPIEASA